MQQQALNGFGDRLNHISKVLQSIMEFIQNCRLQENNQENQQNEHEDGVNVTNGI